MSKVWLVTDHHFGHDNIIKFAPKGGTPYRPFANIEEHDEHLIESHNNLVADQDVVYFGGDLGGDKKHLESVLKRLRGRKRLILGNHDTYSIEFYKRHFERIRAWYMFGDGIPKIIFTHFPLAPESFHPTKPWMNVHGHIHNWTVQHQSDKYYNLCPEHAGYSPWSADHLLKVAQLRHEEGKL